MMKWYREQIPHLPVETNKKARATALQYEVDLKVINPSLLNETANKQKQLLLNSVLFSC